MKRGTATWFSCIRRPSLVETSLNTFRSEQHSYKAERTGLRHNHCLNSINLGNFNLIISAVCIQCWEYRGIPKRIDTFVRALHRVWIQDRQYVQFPIIDAEVKRAVILRDKPNLSCSLRLGGLYNVNTEHLVSLLLLEFSLLRPWSICGWFYRSAICLVAFDSGLHRFERTEVYIPHALKLCEHGNTLLTIREILVRYRQSIF